MSYCYAHRDEPLRDGTWRPPSPAYVRGGYAEPDRLRHPRRPAVYGEPAPAHGGLRRGRALRRRRHCAVPATATHLAGRAVGPRPAPADHAARASSRPRSGPTKRLSRRHHPGHSGAGQYRDVDSWTLRPRASRSPATDTSGTALWLDGVTQRRASATPAITLPPVHVRRHCMLPNRVDSVTDGCPPLNRYRISAISNGDRRRDHASTTRQPSARPGDPARRRTPTTKRCYPVRWAMPTGARAGQRLVPQVRRRDGRRGRPLTDADDVVTKYAYTGGGAWAYDDNPLVAADRRIVERVAWFPERHRHQGRSRQRRAASRCPGPTTSTSAACTQIAPRRVAPSRSASRIRTASRCSTGSRSRASCASRSRTTARRSSRARSTTRGSSTMAQRAISPPTRWRTCGP